MGQNLRFSPCHRQKSSSRACDFSEAKKKVQIPAVFSAANGALKELKALKAYPMFWWWRRGTGNSGAKPGKTDGGRRKRPTGERPVYKSIIKDPLCQP
jgi:hypothetical protein